MVLAPVLSQYIGIGYSFVGTTPSPKINFLFQTASLEASEATIYSASIDDVATVLYLALFQSTAPPFEMKTYPVSDFESSTSV